MKILVYEWVSGGGMLGLEGPLPESLLREGKAMASAVAQDFLQLPGAHVTLLRDVRVMDFAAAGCKLLNVDSATERDAFLQEQFDDADAVLLIAPETDGHLLRVVQQAERAGAKLVSPGSAMVEVAGDKSLTAARLASAGVRVPQGVVVPADEPLPEDFPFPAVIKPRDGAGSEDTYWLAQASDAPPHAFDRQLETYCAGLPMSVSLLLDGQGAVPLMPCEQTLSSDGRLRYLGGKAPVPDELAARATRLAVAAVTAMPAAIGYVGIDLVLGSDPSGTEDVVIEINPRLTSSYAGLRHAAQSNLAEAMLAIRESRAPRVEFASRPIAFDASGVVRYDADHAL